MFYGYGAPFRFPLLITLNISSSATGFTLGIGTSHFPAFSFLFCLTVLLSTYVRGNVGCEAGVRGGVMGR